MIEETGEAVEETKKIRLVSERKRELEDNYIEVRKQIESRFEEVTKYLDRRKNQLLRQAEAIHRQQESLIHQSKVFAFKKPPRYSLNLENFNKVEKLICNVGKLELDGDLGCITDLEPCKMSEYSDRDFECFNKKIERDSETMVERIERTWKSKGCFGKIEDEKGWRAASLDLEVSMDLKWEQMSSTKSESNVQNILEDFSSKPKLGNQFWNVYTESRDTNRLNSPSKGKNKGDGSKNIGPTAARNRDEKSTTDGLQSQSENDSKGTKPKSESDKSENNGSALDDESSLKTSAQWEQRSNNENIIEKLTSSPKKRSASPKSSRKEISSHPEQVKQWLEQIQLETEIEPNINEDGKIALKKLNMVN